MSVLIPKGFRKIAETTDKIKQSVCSIFYSEERGKYFIQIDYDWSMGPLTKNQLEVLLNVVKDVTDMRSVRYIE